MKGIHPKVSRAAQCAIVAALLAGGGCRSMSSGANNPFMAPDRVSPPSTRVIAPGQAQPYYQGDPLPVMQSGATPPANGQVAGSNSAEALSSSGKTLAWNNPGGASPAAPPSQQVAANPAAPWGVNPPPATPVSYGNEQPVSVPVDTGSLRFALPAPINPEPATPIAAAAPTVQQAAPTTGVTPNQPVMLASYNAPNAPVASAPTLPPTPPVASPWHTPVSSAAPAPVYGMQPLPQPNLVAQQAPVAAYANPVAVQLRSVPPPPPQPGDPMPRIRIPGYEVPQAATADGFRPRTSMQ